MSKGYKSILNQVLIAAIASILAAPGVANAKLDISRALKDPGFKPDRTAVAVVDAESGELIASHQPDLALNPASCAKIITAAAALDSLGPDYRFSTDVYTDRRSPDGRVGNLYVVGDGDPFLVSERLWLLARRLAGAGVTGIDGDIVIDDSYFDSHEYPNKMEGSDRAYAALTAAVAVNFNSVTVNIAPGEKANSPALVTLDPPADYFKLVNNVKTGGKYNIGIRMREMPGGEIVEVSGKIPANSPPTSFYRSIADPVAYAGSALKFVLGQNGIHVSGQVRGGKLPGGVKHLASLESLPLSAIVQRMNKFSNNFIAEQIMKSLGAIRYGKPGSTEKGAKALEDYLVSNGISHGSYLLENGSGLSDKSRVSAAQLAAVLVSAYRDFAIRPEMLSSFSIFGVDGTMRKWKYEPSLKAHLRAKTGTLGGVVSLAGYVPMANGRIAAFAILANGLPRGADAARSAEIKLVREIAGVRP